MPDALHKVDSSYQMLFENAGDAIFVHTENKILAVNRKTCKMLGYTEDELLRMRPNEMNAVEGRMEVPEQMAKLKKHKFITFETIYQKKNGTRTPVEITAQSVDWNGEPSTMSICRDNTTRGNYDKIVLGAAMEWQNTFDSIDDAIFLLSPENRILRCNKACYRIFNNFKPGEILGKLCWEVAHLASEPIPACPLAVMKNTKKKETSVFESGGCWFESTVEPILDQNNDISGVIHIFSDITGRKRAEDELLRSEEKYRQLYSSMVDAFALVDIEGKIRKVNHQFCEMLGYSEAELKNKSYQELTPSRWHEMEARILKEKTLKAGDSDIYEKEYRCKDGSIIQVQLRISLIRDKNGSPSAMWAIVRNISDIKSKEEELLRVSARMSLATRAGGVGVWDWDVATNRLVWDAQMHHLFGVAPDKFRGIYEAWKAGLHPEDLLRADSEVKMALRDKKDLDTEFRVVWPDGSVRNIRALAIVQYDAIGQPVRMIGTNWDITEVKRSESALKAASLYSRNLIEASIDPLVTIRADGKITDVNNAMEKATGICRERLNGTDFADYFTEPEKARAIYREAFKHGSVIDYPLAIRHTTGAITDVLYNASVYRNEKGEVVGIIATARDITERKKRDVELQRLNRTLKAQSQSDQAMMHARDESDYMDEACRIIVRTCGYAMAWIGFTKHDEDKSVCTIANAGFEKGYLETLKISWSDTECGQNPTGIAIRTGKLGVRRNILTDPAFQTEREQAIKFGYESYIAIPLIAEGSLFGALTIYSREPDPFTKVEMLLLSELADEMAYGIMSIRLHSALHKSKQIANAVLNAITDAIWLVDLDGCILASNSIAAERMGVHISETEGKNYFKLLPPELDRLRRKQVRQVLDLGRPTHFEEEERSGTFFNNSIYPARDGKGNIVGLTIYSTDVTARKWTENRLAHQHAILEALIENSDGQIFSLDRNYCYTFFNSQHKEAMIGADIREGLRMLDHYTNQNDAAFVKKNIDMALRGEQVSFDTYLGGKAPTRRHFRMSCNPILETGGTVIGVAVFAKDLAKLSKADTCAKKGIFSIKMTAAAMRFGEGGIGRNTKPGEIQ